MSRSLSWIDPARVAALTLGAQRAPVTAAAPAPAAPESPLSPALAALDATLRANLPGLRGWALIDAEGRPRATSNLPTARHHLPALLARALHALGPVLGEPETETVTLGFAADRHLQLTWLRGPAARVALLLEVGAPIEPSMLAALRTRAQAALDADQR
jgi:hypothetical protein